MIVAFRYIEKRHFINKRLGELFGMEGHYHSTLEKFKGYGYLKIRWSKGNFSILIILIRLNST